jgi:hypothetical protein
MQKLDGHITCYRCKGTARDVIGERKGEVLSECCYCGAMEWCVAMKKHIKGEPSEAGEFRFKYGRFVGMTLAEAESQPNGRRYLEWMAANNEALRDRISSHLSKL